MNPYKLRAILEFIRSQDGLGTRDAERVWSVDDVVAYLRLDQFLTNGELLVVRRELEAMAEADMFMEELRARIRLDGAG